MSKATKDKSKNTYTIRKLIHKWIIFSFIILLPLPLFIGTPLSSIVATFSFFGMMVYTIFYVIRIKKSKNK